MTASGAHAPCPKWADGRHNDLTLRGTVLFWRRYRACCSCGRVERQR